MILVNLSFSHLSHDQRTLMIDFLSFLWQPSNAPKYVINHRIYVELDVWMGCCIRHSSEITRMSGNAN